MGATYNGKDYKYDSIDKPLLSDKVDNVNPYDVFEWVKVINNNAGYNYVLYDAEYFENVVTEGVTRVP
jgi:hypothetical protein